MLKRNAVSCCERKNYGAGYVGESWHWLRLSGYGGFPVFTFERADELQISGCPEKYRNENNLVYRSFELALAHWGEEPFPIKLHIDAAIPVSRGLGSSSTCTVAGIMGAAALTGRIVGRAEAVSIATEMEGHPDNVAPVFVYAAGRIAELHSL